MNYFSKLLVKTNILTEEEAKKLNSLESEIIFAQNFYRLYNDKADIVYIQKDEYEKLKHNNKLFEKTFKGE